MPGMRRMGALMAVAIVAMALPSAHAGQRATLRFAGTHPLAVTGHEFARAENVRVTVHRGATSTTLRTRANGHGAFRVTFAGVTVASCDPLDIEAVGAHGDRARLLRRAPACAAR
jgi:hypothetical protein